MVGFGLQNFGGEKNQQRLTRFLYEASRQSEPGGC
jgi:hypothetical protein